MTFRDRLLATIREARPVLEVPDVLVVGSEVPNLLETGLAATLVVSRDLDVGVPVGRHAVVKQRLPELLPAFEPSPEEPSVWTPRSADLLEVNFLGIDSSRDPDDAYVSLLEARAGMPDPGPRRHVIVELLRRLEGSLP